MPFPSFPAVPADMPDEIVDAASEQDALIEDELSALMPQPTRPFKSKVLTALSKAVADATRLLGIDLEPVTYTDDSPLLDTDLLRLIVMLEKAAEDYGKPYPVSIGDVVDDQGLTAITAHLASLAKDKAFQDFLEGPAGDFEEDEDEAMRDEEEAAKDFDFASRI